MCLVLFILKGHVATVTQVTMEGRAGALAAMHSFLQFCPELLTDDIVRRLLTPIEAALAMLIK